MTKDEIILAQQARIEKLRNCVLNNCMHADNCDVLCLDDEGRHMPCSCGLSAAIDTKDDLSALRAHDAKLLAPYQWQPIETAPKGELIAIWIVGTNKNGQKWSDEEGECWLYSYHDNICGDWRTTRPSGHLRCVPDRFVTHWMPLPSTEAIEKGGV